MDNYAQFDVYKDGAIIVLHCNSDSHTPRSPERSLGESKRTEA